MLQLLQFRCCQHDLSGAARHLDQNSNLAVDCGLLPDAHMVIEAHMLNDRSLGAKLLLQLHRHLLAVMEAPAFVRLSIHYSD